MTILQALLIGLVYYMGSSFWLNGYLTVSRPFVAAALVGLVLGQPSQGALMGAYIQLLYMSWMSVGGSQPSDACMAGTLATAFALAGGLDVNAALVLSLPLGLLGSRVWVARNSLNVRILHRAERPAREGNAGALFALNTLAPQLPLLLITFVPVSLAAYFGAMGLRALLPLAGGGALRLLSAAGSLLPAAGIAMTLKALMKRRAVPFFLFGFLLSVCLSLSPIAVAAFAAAGAAAYLLWGSEAGMLLPTADAREKFRSSSVAKKDLLWASVKWYLFAWQCVNYERFVSLGLASSINHILAKLYKDKDELAQALTRHMEFFNTEPYIGVVIMGIVVSMEEERAQKGEDAVPGETISSVKTGLMGLIAGFADLLNQGVFFTLFLAVGTALTLSLSGGAQALGPVVFALLCSGFMAAETWHFAKYGYCLGKQAALTLLQSEGRDKLVDAGSMVVCALMGSLTAYCVDLRAPLALASSLGLRWDALGVGVPALLSLGAVWLCLSLFRKKAGPTRVMLILMAAGAALSALGLLF